MEIGDGFVRQGRRRLGIRILQELWSDPRLTIVPVTEATLEQATALYLSHRDKEWGLTDCVSFELMRGHVIVSALTADRHFEQAGFHPLLLRGKSWRREKR